MALVALALLLVVVAASVNGVGSSKWVKITNYCSYTVWPGIASGAGAASAAAAALNSTGFELAPGDSRSLPVPSGWSGRVWGRTFCSTTTGSSGRFTCVTGDCGSGRQECAGGDAAPPVTLAQFTLDGSGGVDLYDVSLVDGYNLPMVVAPDDGSCAMAGCVVDLNVACPTELRVTSSSAGTGAVACKSACQAFGSPQYCCAGAYRNPERCKPSAYSELFKKACAHGSTATRTTAVFTCGGGGGVTTYDITFCASTTTRLKKASRK